MNIKELKEKLAQDYIVVTKTKWNKDVEFVLLSKITETYMGSFSISESDKNITIYNTNFKDFSIYNLIDLLDILKRFKENEKL